MSKKKIIAITLCCAATIAIAAAKYCSCGFFNKRATIDTITIEASPDAKERVEKMMAGKEKSDEAFIKLITTDSPIFHRTGKQTLPKVEMKHTPAVSVCERENVYTISNPGYDKVIIYIHGGAFMFGIDPLQVKFCDKLVDTLNAKVIMPLYPLSPQAKWRTTYAMLTEIYKQALKENKPVYLMGDSAGAVLSLGLAMQLKQDKMPEPAKIVAISPSTDTTFSNKDIPKYEAKDPMFHKKSLVICISYWADKEELKNYHISPLYGDLKNLPDILLFTGNKEIFYPDITLFADKLTVAGNKTKLVIGNGLPHDFPLITAQETEKSLAIIKEFVERR